MIPSLSLGLYHNGSQAGDPARQPHRRAPVGQGGARRSIRLRRDDGDALSLGIRVLDKERLANV